MSAPVILIEAQPRRAADGVAETVRLAGGGAVVPYVYGGLNDWRAGVAGLPKVIASLEFVGGEFPSGSVPAAAEVVWSPSSRTDLAELAGFVWFDAPITVRVGQEGQALPPVAMSGAVLAATSTKGQLSIALADPATALKKPLLTTRYAGTGGLEGPVEWDGKIKRRIWGRVWNLQGEPIDKANNIYCFADPARALQAVVSVRDKGAAAATLNLLAWQGSAAATLTALQAAVAPQGGGVACPSIACVKWWTQPAGDLCADLKGEVGAGYVETTAEIVQRLVEAIGGPAFSVGTIAAAQAARPAAVGWVASDDSTTVANMLDELLAQSSLLWLLEDAGTITLRPWAWGASVASAISQDVSRKEVLRPVATRKLGYRRNELTMQRGDLAGIVLASDVAFQDGTPVEDLKPGDGGATRNLPAQIFKDGDFGGAYWTFIGDAGGAGTELSPNRKGATIGMAAGQAAYVRYGGSNGELAHVEPGKTLFLRLFATPSGSEMVPIRIGPEPMVVSGISVLASSPVTAADWPLSIEIEWFTASEATLGRGVVAVLSPAGGAQVLLTTVIPPPEARLATVYIGHGAEVTGTGKWVVWSPWLDEHQPSADVTAEAQVVVEVPLAERDIAADYTGALADGALADVVWSAKVTRGGAAIKLAGGTSYALTGVFGGTLAVDNTEGSPTKGNVTISAMPALVAGGELVVTVDGIAQPSIALRLNKVLGPPPSSAIGAVTTWSSADFTGTSSTSYVAISSVKTIALTSGQALYGTAPLVYYLSGGMGVSLTMTFKWQYADAGSGSWNDFAVGITGSDATAAYTDGEGFYNPAEPGYVEVTQAKSGLAAGNYDIRLVALNSVSGRLAIPAGSAAMEAKP